jgi:hypothetical protein
MRFPLPFGQGEPLPRDFPYKGQWLIQHVVFLYRPGAAELIGGTAPRFTATATSNGRECKGFDATQLAAAFGIEPDQLFAANEAGTLSLLKTEDASELTGIPALRFIFGIGEKQIELVVEAPRDPGSA